MTWPVSSSLIPPHGPACRREEPVGQFVELQDLRAHEDARRLGGQEAAFGGPAARQGRRHEHQAAAGLGPGQGLEVSLQHAAAFAASGGADDEFHG